LQNRSVHPAQIGKANLPINIRESDMMKSTAISMQTMTVLFGLAAAISIAFAASIATAQQSGNSTSVMAQGNRSGGQAKLASFTENISSPRNSNLRKVGFRLLEWKTIHAESEAAAKENVSSLKKIGCEVQMSNHGNHIDVRYRCPQWKAMELPTDQLAAQWTEWLKGKSLETVVVNPPANTKKPTVDFRMAAPQTLHLHDPQKANEIIGTLRLIGVEVAVNNHGNHLDATFQCPNWTTIELPSDSNAHVWQKWLDEAGFETKHTH
jgi:biotin operon repressor